MEDPIINVGIPIIQSYLAGLESRRRHEQNLAMNAQQEQELLFRQRRAQTDDYQQDRAYGLQNRIAENNAANMTADNDRAMWQRDYGQRQEEAAQSMLTQQAMPYLAGGLASGMSADPMADMERVQGFAKAPSAVQERVLGGMRQMAAQEAVRADRERRKTAALIAIDRSEFDEQQKRLMRLQIESKYANAPLSDTMLGVGVGGEEEAEMSPEQMEGYAADLQSIHPMATPDRAAAAVRLRQGGFPIGLGEANLSGQMREKVPTYDQTPEYKRLDEKRAILKRRYDDAMRRADDRYTGARPTTAREVDKLAGELDAVEDAILNLGAQPTGARGQAGGGDAIDQLIDSMTPEQIRQILGGP